MFHFIRPDFPLYVTSGFLFIRSAPTPAIHSKVWSGPRHFWFSLQYIWMLSKRGLQCKPCHHLCFLWTYNSNQDNHAQVCFLKLWDISYIYTQWDDTPDDTFVDETRRIKPTVHIASHYWINKHLFYFSKCECIYLFLQINSLLCGFTLCALFIPFWPFIHESTPRYIPLEPPFLLLTVAIVTRVGLLHIQLFHCPYPLRCFDLWCVITDKPERFMGRRSY